MESSISCRYAAQAVCQQLTEIPDRRWRENARDSEWTCERVWAHVAECHLQYQALLTRASHRPAWLPIELTFESEESVTVEDLRHTVITTATMLDNLVAALPASTRAYHPYGVSDPEGFAAMGAVEVIVHGWDILHAEDPQKVWMPPQDLVLPLIKRLFARHVAETPQLADATPAQALLHLTGRKAFGDLPRKTTWRWDGRPN